ncbi:MAG: tetratricopeptide repeat protein [Myxococcota bacterium]
MLQRGQTIGRYVIEGMLGSGGMAEVWAIRHEMLGTRYALKVLTRASEELQQRLLREGRAAARLAHPNLVPVFDLLDVDGWPGLMMPLIEGPTLEAVLARKPLVGGDALALFRGILHGVGFAHNAGLIHRDLKPSNVLLDLAHGVTPRIIDFGLVKLHDDALATRVGVFMGTPAYAAPEHLDDVAAADARSDLFSLGVLFYRMLTGRLPFGTGTIATIRNRQEEGASLTGIPSALSTVLAMLLQVDPRRRLPTAAAVLEELPESEPLTRSSTVAQTARTVHSPPSRPNQRTTGSAPASMTSVPRERDRFIGRRHDIAQITERFDGDARLVNLTGPGGVGKTRLAVRYAHEQSAPVLFCDFSESRTSEDALFAFATRLQIRLGATPREALVQAIRERGATLFILDNLEQIAQPISELLNEWLDQAPRARFLVTSRQPLHLRGEALVLIDPLSTDDARALFIERAQAIDPRFAETPQIDEVVELLDRLPLAIELAAARSRMLRPAQLLKRLQSRFAVLRSSLRGVPARQRTLKATIDWSWEMLTTEEQATLAQASIFDGGFSMDAAEAVVRTDEDLWIEEVLTTLVDKSLLQVNVNRDGPRFSMLLSVQDYARARLTEPEDVIARHSVFFAEYTNMSQWRSKVDYQRAIVADFDNIAAAYRHALKQAEPQVLAALLDSLVGVWSRQGPLQTAITTLEEALPRLNAPQFSFIWNHYANVLSLVGQLDRAIKAAAQAYALAESDGEASQQSKALYIQGKAFRKKGDYDAAIEALQAALTIKGIEGSRRAFTKLLIGIVYSEQGQTVEGERWFEDVLLDFRAGTDPYNTAGVLGNLGHLYFFQGELSRSLEAHQEALKIIQTVKDPIIEGSTLGAIGEVKLEMGALEEAASLLERGVKILEATGYSYHMPVLHTALSDLALLQGDITRARAHTEQARTFSHNAPNHTRVWLSQARIGFASRDIPSVRTALTAAAPLSAPFEVEQERQVLHALLALRDGALEEARKMLSEIEETVVELGFRPTSRVRMDVAAMRAWLNEEPMTPRPLFAVLLRSMDT